MWLLLILVAIAVLVILNLGLRLVENLESENRAVEAELRAVQMYDDALSARMKQMQRFRHDIEGLLQTIEYRSLAQSTDGGGAYEVARGYRSSTGSLVDALLELKRAQCDSACISFADDVNAGWRAFSQQRGIEEADVQAVVQNLLQNAYEASLEVLPKSDRLIDFRMGDQGGTLHIEVTNRIASDVMPTFETTKSNSEQHGIGLKVVEDIARIYNGGKTVAFDPQTRLLTVCVTLESGSACF